MRWETRCAPRGATRIGIECIVYIHILRRLVMAHAITTPIRQIASKGRQPKRAREARKRSSKQPQNHSELMQLIEDEVTKLNDENKSFKYPSKEDANVGLIQWAVRFVDRSEARFHGDRVKIARKVIKRLTSSKRLVMDPDPGRRRNVTVYSVTFLAKKNRQLAMAAHPSTGNVTTIRKGVAA